LLLSVIVSLVEEEEEVVEDLLESVAEDLEAKGQVPVEFLTSG